jgi:DNA-binding transcriptional ArsR family regulator
MASLLRALVPEAARAILVALADGPKVQRELAAALHLPQVLVNQHLAPLCEHGLVESEGEGAAAKFRLSNLVTAVPKNGVVALTLSTDEGDTVTVEVARGSGGRL